MIEFIVLKGDFSNQEIISRMHYCNNAFHLYFTYEVTANSLVIKSFPKTSVKYLFIVGHNHDICKYLLSKKEQIENVIIISCKVPKNYINKFNAKRIFVSKRESDKNYFYNGKEWGFNFDITEDELDLFNISVKDIQDKVRLLFRRVK